MENSFFYRNKKIIFGVLILISAAIFVDGILLNAELLRDIARVNPFVYGIRQLVAILLLQVFGYFTLVPLEGLPRKWRTLFAFPVGMVVWVIPSYIQLLTGIPYTLMGTVGIILVFLIILNRASPVSRERLAQSRQQMWEYYLPWLMLVACFLAGSGISYVFRSFDTYFFFTNYGKTLAIWGNYADFVGEKVFVFNQVGQFLPILNAYTSMLGLDQSFQIMVFADYVVVLIFGAGVYDILTTYERKKSANDKPVSVIEREPSYEAGLKARIMEVLVGENIRKMTVMKWAAISTAFLITCTSFVIGSRWAISNMYCMLFIFIITVTLHLEMHEVIDKKSFVVLVAISGSALAILRKDGIIIYVFLMMVITCSERFSKKNLMIMLLPGSLMELSWIFYVKVIIGMKTMSRQVRYGSTTIASTKNVLFIVAIVVTGILFVLIGLKVLKYIEGKAPVLNRYRVMMLGLLVMIVPCVMKKGWLIFDNFDYTVRNLFGYDSAWGFSAYTLFVLVVMACIPRPKLDMGTFIWAGYAVLNFVSYSMIDDKVLWVNWDDSYSRVLMQIVPVVVFICAEKIWKNVVRESKSSEA